MFLSSRVLAPCCAVVMLLTAGLGYAEQYRYQDEQGHFVVSSEKPSAGVSYAVLDDEGVYQYLVHATAAVTPSVDWPSESDQAQKNQQKGVGLEGEDWLQVSRRQD